MSTTYVTRPATATTTTRRAHSTVILPYMPESTGKAEREIYMAFIRALREGTQRRMEVRILTSIHRAADATDNSDAYVSRVLADMGLIASRLAFPGDFLDHVDATMLRDRPLHSVPASYLALTQHWAAIGEELYDPALRSSGKTDQMYGFLAMV